MSSLGQDHVSASYRNSEGRQILKVSLRDDSRRRSRSWGRVPLNKAGVMRVRGQACRRMSALRENEPARGHSQFSQAIVLRGIYQKLDWD